MDAGDAHAWWPSEAKTVLKALYLGACLLNGALGLTADGGREAGRPAPAAKVGTANIWVGGMLNGTVL